ncbi:MAG: FeoA family protein [Betaproteobacteria bacterium]
MSNKIIQSTEATLDHAAIGHPLIVHQVQAPLAAPEWARWLEEIGFLIGEKVMLMARSLPGGDPLVVRVGQSTFALRKAEAACVQVAAEAHVRPEVAAS